MNLAKDFIFTIFFGIIITTVGCQQQSSISENKKQKTESTDLESQNINPEKPIPQNEEKITFLEKIGEIKDGFCKGEYNYFVKITSLCVDADDNLYVADSGIHRIFKFSNQSKYISSFGSQGQGPGEFLGTIRASIGNDGRLYVTDYGNWRLSIFASDGKFIRQFPIPKFLYDMATADYRGEIYFLSQSGLKIIDLFDSDMKFKESFLEMSYHLTFPYQHPPKTFLKRMMIRPLISEIHKLLTKDDHLFIVFNNTQIVVELDKNHKLFNQFKIQHERFVKDYKARLKKAVSEEAWISCFGSIYFDDKENLCLCYFNDTYNLPEIYRYRKDGTFVDTLRVKATQNKTNQLVGACDNRGNFYSIDSNLNKIIIFRLF